MVQSRELQCWEITQCSNTENCVARRYPEIPCWEIARRLNCYQSAESVCRDCVVYVVKQVQSELQHQQVDDIVKQRCQDARPYCPLSLTEKGRRTTIPADLF